jgi:hypothetical protein
MVEHPEERKGPGMHPIAVMCQICGREFGTMSLSIHQKQCTKRWEDEEARKPRAQRRQLPQAPSVST